MLSRQNFYLIIFTGFEDCSKKKEITSMYNFGSKTISWGKYIIVMLVAKSI